MISLKHSFIKRRQVNDVQLCTARAARRSEIRNCHMKNICDYIIYKNQSLNMLLTNIQLSFRTNMIGNIFLYISFYFRW